MKLTHERRVALAALGLGLAAGALGVLAWPGARPEGGAASPRPSSASAPGSGSAPASAPGEASGAGGACGAVPEGAGRAAGEGDEPEERDRDKEDDDVAPEASGSVGLAPGRETGAAKARQALVAALEQALGASVRVRFEGEGLRPRSLVLAGAAPLAGTAESAAGTVAARVLAVLGEPDVSVAGPAETPAREGPSLGAQAALESRGRALVPLQAFLDGLPVEDGKLSVELERVPGGLAPVRIVGRLRPALALEGGFDAGVERDVRERTPDFVGPGFRAEPEVKRVAFESEPGVARRALEVTAPGPRGPRRRILDGETGACLADFPLACAGRAEVVTWEKDPRGRRVPQPLAELSVTQKRRKAVTDEDGKDALAGDVELARGLDGPLVRVWPDGAPPLAYSGPADFTLLAGRGDSATVHQDEAAAFVFATTYNAFMGETYPEIAKAARVKYAIVVGSGFENGFFAPEKIASDDGESFPGYVDLGAIGGRSLARDATVVKHEYTHALLNGCSELYGNDEALGVNEGLADYFPCASYDHPRVGEWATPPYIRALDGRPKRLVYPDDVDGDPHRTGNIFNQALWQARTEAERGKRGGRLEIDQAVFAGVLRMPSGPSLADACEAVLAGDAAVNGGRYQDELARAFAAHGLGDGSGGGAAPPSAPGSTGRGSDEVSFDEPTHASVVAHVGEPVEIPVEATNASGERVVLSATRLAHARFTKTAGATARGTLRFTPVASQRGRQVVTFTAKARDGEATRAVAIVVRVRRGS